MIKTTKFYKKKTLTIQKKSKIIKIKIFIHGWQKKSEPGAITTTVPVPNISNYKNFELQNSLGLYKRLKILKILKI